MSCASVWPQVPGEWVCLSLPTYRMEMSVPWQQVMDRYSCSDDGREGCQNAGHHFMASGENREGNQDLFLCGAVAPILSVIGEIHLASSPRSPKAGSGSVSHPAWGNLTAPLFLRCWVWGVMRRVPVWFMTLSWPHSLKPGTPALFISRSELGNLTMQLSAYCHISSRRWWKQCLITTPLWAASEMLLRDWNITFSVWESGVFSISLYFAFLVYIVEYRNWRERTGLVLENDWLTDKHAYHRKALCSVHKYENK